MKLKYPLLVTGMALSLLGAGCGSSTTTPPATPNTPSAQPAPAVAPKPTTPPVVLPPAGTPKATTPVATATISINKSAFSPSKITVKQGTEVIWKNNDVVDHTIIGDNGIASARLKNGDIYKFDFPVAGTYAYHCSLHPSMTGTITVVP